MGKNSKAKPSRRGVGKRITKDRAIESLDVPERREKIVYVRLKPCNKLFLEELAKRKGVSQAILMDCIIDEMRKNDSNQGKRR